MMALIAAEIEIVIREFAHQSKKFFGRNRCAAGNLNLRFYLRGYTDLQVCGGEGQLGRLRFQKHIAQYRQS